MFEDNNSEQCPTSRALLVQLHPECSCTHNEQKNRSKQSNCSYMRHSSLTFLHSVSQQMQSVTIINQWNIRSFETNWLFNVSCRLNCACHSENGSKTIWQQIWIPDNVGPCWKLQWRTPSEHRLVWQKMTKCRIRLPHRAQPGIESCLHNIL